MSEQPLLRRVSVNASSQAAADVAGKLAILALYAVIARRLGTAALGYLTLAQSMALLLQLSALGTDPLIIGELARTRDRLSALLWNSLAIKALLGGGAGVAIVVVVLLADLSSEVRVTFILFAASGVVDLLAGTLVAILRGMEAMVPVAYSQFVQRVLTTLLGTALLLAGHGMVVVGCAYVAGSIIAAALLLAVLWRASPLPAFALDLRAARRFAIDSWPLGVGTAFGALLARADAVMLSILTSATVVGIYGAAYRVMESTFFLSWAIGVAIFPVLSRLSPDTQPSIGRAFELASRFCYALLLPLGAVLALFPHSVIDAVFGPSFSGAAAPLRWLSIVVALYGLGAIAIYALAARDRRRTIAWVSLLALAVNVAANLVLIPGYGATGAGAAMALAQIVFTGAAIRTVARDVGGLSLLRLSLLPSASVVAMGCVRVACGDRVLGILVGTFAYATVLVIAHARLYPADQKIITGWLRRGLRPLPAPDLQS